jgi:hypothetical protein
VRALVIDGVLDPRLWADGTHIRIDRIATAAEFEEFLRLCDEAACPLAGRRGASARFFGLARKLREDPIVLDDGTIYSYDYLVADAASAMYEPESWADYGYYFASLVDAARGDANAAAAALALREALRERLERPDRTNYWNDWEGYYGNQCADTGYPSTLARFREVADFAESGSIFGPYWWWMNASCARWPVAQDRYAGPWTAHTSRPVLVVGNYFDGVTDYAGAVASSTLLPNSRLLSYAGWGHTAYGRSECVTRHVDRYLLHGTLPREGKVCPANPNPFLSAGLRAASRVVPVGIRPPPPRPGAR